MVEVDTKRISKLSSMFGPKPTFAPGAAGGRFQLASQAFHERQCVLKLVHPHATT